MDPFRKPSSTSKSSSACSASGPPEKMMVAIDSSSIFTTKTTTSTTTGMESKKMEETHATSGGDSSGGGSGTSTGSDSNNNNRVAVAPIQLQQQSHSSSSSASSSSSSSAWSLRSKSELSRPNISPESNNGSQKSYQFCRICHEGDTGNCSGISPSSSQGSSASRREPLIAPCRCTGSVATVHLSCLEHWLTTSNSEKCELCNFIYKTKKMPRSWTEFLTDSDNQFNVRNMIADLICFLLLTPLLIISTYLCCLGAHQYYIRERWEAIGLVTLSVFLLAVYFTWCHVTLKYHFGVWQTWARTHQRVQITFGDGSIGQYCRTVSPVGPVFLQQQQQPQRNSRNQRLVNSVPFGMEDDNRNSQRRHNLESASESSGPSAHHQFDYVNILEEDDDYYDYHGRHDSTENLYIVNQNSSYNNRFPYNFNRHHYHQQASQSSGGGGNGNTTVDGGNSNIFSYCPVIVIPNRRLSSQRLLNTSSGPVNTEPNFPVMGLSSFSTFLPNNRNNNSDNNSTNNNASHITDI